METPPSQLRGETREGIVGGALDRDAADGVDGGDDAVESVTVEEVTLEETTIEATAVENSAPEAEETN